MGKRGRRRVQTWTFSEGVHFLVKSGGAHPAKLQFFLGRAVRRGAFFRPRTRGGGGRRTATAQRVRVTRARPPFFDFSFTLWT